MNFAFGISTVVPLISFSFHKLW